MTCSRAIVAEVFLIDERPNGLPFSCRERAGCASQNRTISCAKRSAATACSASGLDKQCFWLLYAEYTSGKGRIVTLLRYGGSFQTLFTQEALSLHGSLYRMQHPAIVRLCRENTCPSMLAGGKRRPRGKTLGETARFDRSRACRRERLPPCSTCHRSLQSHTEYAHMP
jgi:hypothetical protein